MYSQCYIPLNGPLTSKEDQDISVSFLGYDELHPEHKYQYRQYILSLLHFYHGQLKGKTKNVILN